MTTTDSSTCTPKPTDQQKALLLAELNSATKIIEETAHRVRNLHTLLSLELTYKARQLRETIESIK